MTRRSLNSAQRRLLDIIESLGFGHIERLNVRNGEPCFASPPRILEEIRLATEPEERADRNDLETLKKAIGDLYSQLSRLGEGVVDIEVRHSLPFRLVLERRISDYRDN